MLESVVSLRELVKLIQERNIKATLLGIGPMSELVIRATLELGRDMNFPVMLIASRNQIDCSDFGGGYVMGWDQISFSDAIRDIAESVNFKGLLYICRDHGGPWQRDEERFGRIPEKEAMNRAKNSYLADLKAGFNVLHIDPTKDPHFPGAVPMQIVISRTIELMEYVEEQIQKLSLKPVSYEVGTEETSGGLISSDAFENFISTLLEELDKRDIPHPAFIVGQTGTLVKMNMNVGNFDAKTAEKLCQISRKYGIGFKEHNADYLSEDILKIHPELGITSANVAPEFGLEETVSLLDLASKEMEKISGNPNIEPSNFINEIQKSALESGRWKKWLTRDDAHLTEKDIANNPSKLRDITKVCGHYVFDQEKVKIARQKLYDNLVRLKIAESPETIVIESVKNSIMKYVDAFNLRNFNTHIGI